ncbi:uncharacterized protein LOC130516065 [Takifugu flavidus]|uniref:uncharacterized protein LOC130516065 n=1 Tax=Takifugu flavidus TaxID=433684 RepID=UPI00254443A1|nr:uncharacterized protein LOC130516065 [Takifugu flavidus]
MATEFQRSGTCCRIIWSRGNKWAGRTTAHAMWVGLELLLGSFEENENRKNQMSHMAGSQHRESSPNKENKLAKPPLVQREASTVQPRPQLSQSPALDRKCCSPSVLRKFGAMLQENEGKLLTESGVVTHQRLTPEPKCPTPSCQRRAASKASVRVPSQKSHADPDVLTGDIVLSQDWVLVSDSGRQNQKDQRGGYSGLKGSHQSPQPAQRRPLATGSPKVKPRAHSGADRDGGLPQRERARKVSPPGVEPRMDYKVSSVSSGPQWAQRGGLPGQDCRGAGDEGLIELLDMLEIQHEYSSSARPAHTACRDDPLQVNQAERSPPACNRSFSRPARPANQRPPSRWASRTPTTRISSPSGPLYRPPSPRTRTRSPASKHRPLLSYSLQTETVIM